MSDHTTYTARELRARGEYCDHADDVEFAYETDYQALAARLAEAEALIRDINGETGFGDLTRELRHRMDAFCGIADSASVIQEEKDQCR